jgi:hypothetical protein
VARAIFKEVRTFCEANADPGRARRYARFFTEGYDAYGVDHRIPQWELNRASWAERLRAAGPEAFIEAGNLLTATGKYEECSFAVLLAEDVSEFYTPELFRGLGGWFDSGGIRNWGHTDVLCKMVLSRFVTGRIVSLDDLVEWRGSPAKFKRRAAAVTLVESIDVRDVAAWLAFIEPLMADSEKVVRQGVGWLLRELWKREPRPVEAFLLKHKDTAPRLIYQYATEKMDAAGKARFRRSK